MPLNPADDTFRSTLAGVVDEAVFRPLTPAYLEEPRRSFRGAGGILVAPRTVKEVAAIVSACNAAKVGIVPYGGGTGLVGGQVLSEGPDPVVLSLERMAKVRATYPAENVMIAEAGGVLSDVQTAAAEADRLFPLSLASEGSCRVGGVLSTNAGGVNVLRYGNARDLCLGLEAVLPTGEIWHGLSRLRKDNTGYDLRNLLIGAEGTLGVITAASLKLFPRPANVGTALFVVPDPAAALSMLSLTQARVGGAVSAFELIHRTGLEFLTETVAETRQPFPTPPEWMVLVELGLAGGTPAADVLTDLFEDGAKQGLVTDGLIAQSEAQRAEFWTVREMIPEANKRIGAVVSHDISVPLGALPEFIAQGWARIAAIGPFRINCFGHVGDGNLHYNVYPPKGEARESYYDRKDEVERAVHDLVHAFGGSFSAEHGVGRLKRAELERYGDPTKLSAMRTIKAALDPNGIMNPGAVLAVPD
ncbi:FAD-binding oxidoreductase [Aliiroseovarius sp. YM-037]|uniref:FAD-binding oxidoreductase n=1 Tax=Aliiroseovarius sp. YM-037 TaxID=3341728 RepID=UPI003A8000B6